MRREAPSSEVRHPVAAMSAPVRRILIAVSLVVAAASCGLAVEEPRQAARTVAGLEASSTNDRLSTNPVVVVAARGDLDDVATFTSRYVQKAEDVTASRPGVVSEMLVQRGASLDVGDAVAVIRLAPPAELLLRELEAANQSVLLAELTDGDVASLDAARTRAESALTAASSAGLIGPGGPVPVQWNVLSPNQGTLGRLEIGVGSQIEPGDRLFSVVTSTVAQGVGTLPSELVDRVRDETTVDVVQNNATGDAVTGLLRLEPAEEGEAPGRFTIDFNTPPDFDNGARLLVSAVTATIKNAVTLPLDVVRSTADVPFVVVADEATGNQERIEVVLGASTSDRVEIVSPDLEGRTVIGP